ncbi:putative erythromycin esterase [Deinococcus aerius]|uniref:Putative erythromycin esterase n=1 Tax=Deinococcus aerius TaxID=200253 RepID=A0A2I9D014_9DEIO|nr:erythromycin esterase family protein [Deinococcus aerius]GBF07859.1 putative erythromycin esterase [Deinococcus aerius]
MQHRNPPGVGWDMADPQTALSSFLGTLPARPRLLGLGEPTHGLEVFPAWRNRIFQTLVQDHGFRSVALESDIIAGLQVNAYVTSGQGTLEEVMQTGFSHGFGAYAGNRALVEWMRAFNAGRGPGDHLHFYGFDAPLEWWAPSPRASLLALHEFLSRHLDDVPANTTTIENLCGDEARWTNPAAVMDAAQSIGNGGDARHLRLLADDLSTRLRTGAPGLAAQPAFWEAELHARTAMGLLQYHALLADPRPTRMARAAALRDLLMADNLGAIARREGERGPTLVFAHNSHLQRNTATMQLGGMRIEWWGAGAHASLRFGPHYAFIASHLDTAPERGIGDPAPDTLEGALMNPAHPAALFSAGELTAALPRELTSRADIPPQAGYFPLQGPDLPLTDGVLFVKDAAS